MAGELTHRGPDHEGIWFDPEAGVGLAHRRLSILDLSPDGHQPMASESSRFQMVFNGEIYNYQLLRTELAGCGHPFRGHSDTEVLLAGFEEWGVERTIERLVGMFAIALWDRREQNLYLIRDRLGEKPLYYGWSGDAFLFGSELKALRTHPAWRADIDRDAIALQMRHNCIPAPYSIYRGIRKLMPGTILCVSRANACQRTIGEPVPYWSARQVVEAGIFDPFKGSAEAAIETLDGLLREAVSSQMVADVPLGAFLSGGIDSSTVVALMQAQSQRPVKTFTIGFQEEGYNEARHARAVAAHLGTDHTELYVSPEETMAIIPKLPTLYDEPFSDSSQIPTSLVAHLARQNVTVCLSGDAGDELFGGYNRYVWGKQIWERMGWLPASLRGVAAAALTSLGPQDWDRAFAAAGALLPRRLRHRLPGDKIHKLAGVLPAESPEALYRGLASHWQDPATLVLGALEPPTALTDRGRWADLPDFAQRMMYLDLVSYLPDDILVKVDRASMGVGLESRVPFLDHRVVEFAWRLPVAFKIREGVGKWLLRQVLYRYVPKALIERPKMGFGVPIDSWLRGPLRDWGEELLGEERLRAEGFLNPALIRAKWMEHLSGKRNWQYDLWDVLMFQAWLDHQNSTRYIVN